MTTYDASIEQCVIGALCIGPAAMKKVIQYLRPEDFTIPACEALYKYMFEGFINNRELDVNLLPQAIADQVKNPNDYVRECMMLAPTTNNVFLHSKVIHEAAQDRKLKAELFDLIESEEKDSLATKAMQKCQDYLLDNVGGTKTMLEMMNEACDKLSEPLGLRIDTGFPRLDGILKGMWGGNLILVGARPSCGKSAYGLDLAEYAASKGHKTLLFSMEMLYDELIERMICRQARIPLDHIIDRTMDDEEIYRYTVACAKLSGLPLVVEDNPNLTVQQIRAKARMISEVELIIVDYIGLLKSSERYSNRNLELGAISRDLKNLAAELKIPIVALAQLNRQKNANEEPQLSDLRDSGELEQNASKVIFLWNVDEEQGIKGCKVAKNRRGKVGKVQMKFEGEFMKFTERAEDTDWTLKKDTAELFEDDEY